MDSSVVFVVFFVFLPALIAQQVPTIVAFWRGHPARWRICTLNLFSPIATRRWIGALMWAISDKNDPVRERIIY